MTADRSSGPALAVVGATGAVGSVLLPILSQRADIWGDIRLIASARSAGRVLAVRGEEAEVLALTEDAFEGFGPGDVVIFLTPPEVSAQWAPVVTTRGAVAVDQSAAFREDPEVPMVVPEVNAHAVRIRPRGIVAGPDCVTAAMIAAVGALHAEYALADLGVSSYQAASAAGRAGSAALRRQLSLVAGTDLGEARGRAPCRGRGHRALRGPARPQRAALVRGAARGRLVLARAGRAGGDPADPGPPGPAGGGDLRTGTGAGRAFADGAGAVREPGGRGARARSWRGRPGWSSSTTRRRGSSRLRRTRPGRIRRGWAGCGPRSTTITRWSSSSAPTISVRARP